MTDNIVTTTDGKTVFDLDALTVEETTEPFYFRFGGQEFTIATHYDPRIFRKFDQGDLAGALQLMLGTNQFARLDAIDQPFDERHLEPLMRAWGAHCGIDTGEASASSRS